MNFSKEDGVSFFKVLLRGSEDYLPLPIAFAEEYLEVCTKKKQKVVLKTNSDVKWRVEYLKKKDKYCFTNGWLKFMKDNCLQNGDFLVFWLLSSSKLAFQVFLYSPNGCLIENQTTIIERNVNNLDNGNKPIVNEETIDDDNSMKSGQRELRKVVRKSYLTQMPLTKDFAKVTGIGTYDWVRLKIGDGEPWEVDVRNWGSGRARKPTLVGRWSKFIKNNKVKVGDSCVFNHAKGNLLNVHVIKKERGRISKKSNKSVKEIDQSLARDHIMVPFTFQEVKVETDSPLENGEKQWSRNKALEAAESFKTDNAFCISPIKVAYNRSWGLYVPLWFLKRYLHSNGEWVDCFLEVSDGRKWGPIKCRGYKSHGKMFGDNSKKFRDENHLVVGDVCVLELNNAIENVLKVTIFRAC